MSLTRSLTLVALAICASSVSICAQERWRRLPRSGRNVHSPRNKLEEADPGNQSSNQGTDVDRDVAGRNGSARVEATENPASGSSERVTA